MSRTRLFNGAKNPNGSRDYKTAVIDAGITAGFTFFGSLTGGVLVSSYVQGGASGAVIAVLSAGVSAGFAFFYSLMASLQIKKPAEVE